MAEAGTVTVRIRVEDDFTLETEWVMFELWESQAASKGSGLTGEQMRGARLFHLWQVEERKRRAALSEPETPR